MTIFTKVICILIVILSTAFITFKLYGPIVVCDSGPFAKNVEGWDAHWCATEVNDELYLILIGLEDKDAKAN